MEQPKKESDKISELIGRFRAGDEGAERAFDELLTQYHPLVESLVTHFMTETDTNLSREDLRQEAVVAFYRSVLSYDLTQNEVGFGLYAKICISHALVSHLRGKKKPAEESLEDSDQGASGTSEDPVAAILEQERIRALYAVIRKNLSDFEYRVWKLYLSGQTAKEIGAAVGREEKAITNAIYRIRKKLRSVLR